MYQKIYRDNTQTQTQGTDFINYISNAYPSLTLDANPSFALDLQIQEQPAAFCE
jgi:hypothetical protein